jgi:hypothetical protein
VLLPVRRIRLSGIAIDDLQEWIAVSVPDFLLLHTACARATVRRGRFLQTEMHWDPVPLFMSVRAAVDIGDQCSKVLGDPRRT